MEQELQAALERHIPLTLALGLRVAEASPALARLSFPLDPNRNHQRTAFGGSLYAAGVLAGWGLLWCVLRREGVAAEVVIAASRERFAKPVKGAFTSECRAPQAAVAAALRTLRRKGRARVDLESEVACGGESCMLFSGTYGLLGGAPAGAAPENAG